MHDIAMQPPNCNTDPMPHDGALDVHYIVDGGVHLLFKNKYVIINII